MSLSIVFGEAVKRLPLSEGVNSHSIGAVTETGFNAAVLGLTVGCLAAQIVLVHFYGFDAVNKALRGLKCDFSCTLSILRMRCI